MKLPHKLIELQAHAELLRSKAWQRAEGIPSRVAESGRPLPGADRLAGWLCHGLAALSTSFKPR